MRTQLSDQQRGIEAALRRHYKAGREIAKIAPNMPSDHGSEQVRLAQEACIGYVADVFGGDPHAFLRAYEEGRINFATIVTHAGRTALGFGPEKRESVYS